MESNQIFGNTDTNFVSFDELQNAFKRPTQYHNFYEQPNQTEDAGYAPSDDFPPNLVNPDGDDLRFEEPSPVDPEKAHRTGERIARLIDTGIDFTLSNFVAKNNETYRADERDLQDIAECWGELAEEKGWSIGPEWSLIILYIMVYGPLVKQAITDRRMAELEARQDILEAQMKTIQMNQPGTQTDQTPTTDGKPNAQPNPSATSAPFSYTQPR